MNCGGRPRLCDEAGLAAGAKLPLRCEKGDVCRTDCALRRTAKSSGAYVAGPWTIIAPAKYGFLVGLLMDLGLAVSNIA